jgi:hypothetical protein
VRGKHGSREIEEWIGGTGGIGGSGWIDSTHERSSGEHDHDASVPCVGGDVSLLSEMYKR